MRPKEPDSARRGLFAALALNYALTLLALAASNVSVDYRSFIAFTLCIMPFLALSAFAHWREAPRLGDALAVFAVGLLAMSPTLALTYAAIGAAQPLADATLARWDAAIGFNWRAFIAFVDSRPWLAESLRYSYSAFSPQMLLIPVCLALAGQTPRACALVFAFMVLCASASLVSVWFPATGAYATYGVGHADMKSINTWYSFAFLDQFNGVRNDPTFVLSLNHAAGILTFPSVHAGVAALCVWGAWRSPTFRWPALALNVAMAAAAVSHASHYAVDVIAGVTLAACSAVIAKRLFLRSEASDRAIPAAAQPSLARSPAGLPVDRRVQRA